MQLEIYYYITYTPPVYIQYLWGNISKLPKGCLEYLNIWIIDKHISTRLKDVLWENLLLFEAKEHLFQRFYLFNFLSLPFIFSNKLKHPILLGIYYNMFYDQNCTVPCFNEVHIIIIFNEIRNHECRRHTTLPSISYIHSYNVHSVK